MRLQLRAGGYVIDFWGLGYDIAERMGLKGTSIASAITCVRCGLSTIEVSA